ncbi:MAG: AtpZ/AtpI family protein [Hydrogenophaga sp.]|uniref:AtpZ/AtpI family protein n=1 Tax=Hydrogenophaga sp. TaxID=1904254 RepID=UPI001D919FDE|nr:AtpZ/AtpI family protein [Hydrogenophaga sp.]MBX3611074.1 AtpZ/AtpI family protein [Hydrogenophaga sp.]
MSSEDELARQISGHRERAELSRREGEPSLMRQLAAVGVLGWMIVLPALGGIALGRWLDRLWHTGLTFTAALLLVGLALGCWSAWHWVHTR